MSAGDISNAIGLTGDFGVYPNSVAWPGSISLTFIGYSLPNYYQFQSGLNGIGTDLDFHQVGILAPAEIAEQVVIGKAAIGDANVIGFNEFTLSSIVFDQEEVGDIIIGKVNTAAVNAGAVTLSVGSELSLAWSNLILNVNEPEMAGDIWIFNTNFEDMNTYVHELGHALGLNHTFIDGIQVPPPGYEEYNSSKYSIMAYARHPAENRDTTEWQLHDIAGLQYLYGKNSLNKTDIHAEFSDGSGRNRICQSSEHLAQLAA